MKYYDPVDLVPLMGRHIAIIETVKVGTETKVKSTSGTVLALREISPIETVILMQESHINAKDGTTSISLYKDREIEYSLEIYS